MPENIKGQPRRRDPDAAALAIATVALQRGVDLAAAPTELGLLVLAAIAAGRRLNAIAGGAR